MTTYVREKGLLRSAWRRTSGYITKNSGGWVDDGDKGVSGSGFVLRSLGVTNPDYKKQILARQDASTDYQTNSGLLILPRYSVRTRGKVERGSMAYAFGTAPFNVDYIVDDIGDAFTRDQALIRFKRKLSAESGHFNLPVPLGELKDLRGLVNTTLPNIGRLLYESMRILKGRRAVPSRAELRRMKRALGDVWLTFSFGIMPTISSMNDLCASISDFLLRQDKGMVRLTAGARKEWFTTASAGATQAASWSWVESNAHIKHRLSYRYTGGFTLDLRTGTDYGISDHLHLSLGALPTVGWELLPFSWVIDYFVTVGPWLDDMFIAPPGNLNYLVLNKRYELWCDISSSFKAASEYELNGVSSIPGYFEYSSFTRSRLTTLPHIGIRVKSLDAIAKNAAYKLANLASVYRGRVL